MPQREFIIGPVQPAVQSLARLFGTWYVVRGTWRQKTISVPKFVMTWWNVQNESEAYVVARKNEWLRSNPRKDIRVVSQSQKLRYNDVAKMKRYFSPGFGGSNARPEGSLLCAPDPATQERSRC